MLPRKITFLLVACLFCAELALKAMDRPQQEIESASNRLKASGHYDSGELPAEQVLYAPSPAEAHQADTSALLPTQTAEIYPAFPCPQQQDTSNPVVYPAAMLTDFWKDVIFRLESCPPRLLKQLIEKGIELERYRLSVRQIELGHTPMHSQHAVLVPHYRSIPIVNNSVGFSFPMMTRTALIRTSQDVQTAHSAEARPIDVIEITSSSSDHEKPRKINKLRWRIDNGGKRNLTQKNIKCIQRVLAKRPPTGHSEWTTALLHEALKQKSHHFELKTLEQFLKKTKEQKSNEIKKS